MGSDLPCFWECLEGGYADEGTVDSDELELGSDKAELYDDGSKSYDYIMVVDIYFY